MIARTLRLVATAMLVTTAGAAGAATVFTDRSLFEGAVGAVLLETFDAPVARNVSITFANGATATTNDLGVPQRINEVRNGAYSGFLLPRAFRTITFDFGRDVFGFGADFARPATLFAAGVFDGLDRRIDIAELIPTTGFFGLVTTTAFRTVTFTSETGVFLPGAIRPAGGATFQLDNLALSAPRPDVAPVPVPPALALLIGAFGALGAFGARRRAGDAVSARR